MTTPPAYRVIQKIVLLTGYGLVMSTIAIVIGILPRTIEGVMLAIITPLVFSLIYTGIAVAVAPAWFD